MSDGSLKTDMPVCSLCHSPIEFNEQEACWRHAGEPFQEGFKLQLFCDRYGYPVLPLEKESTT